MRLEPIRRIRRRKPSRLFLFLYHRRKAIFVGVVLLYFTRNIYRPIFRYAQCYSREAGVNWIDAPIMDVTRPCPPVNFETISIDPRIEICLTTLTDQASTSFWQRLVRCRDFDNVQTLQNHQLYANKHGYRFQDGSSFIDTARPPAWSKIRAVQALFREECDWVLWLDADAVIMNSDIRIESFVPADPNIHLLVTYDRKFTYNSGAWLIRNSPWSRQFLETWWNQRDFVELPGASLSGDNRAFGHILTQVPDTWAVQEVPRCTFNSFAIFVTQHLAHPELQSWYGSEEFYHQGDFIAHASGIDKKARAVELLLRRAT